MRIIAIVIITAALALAGRFLAFGIPLSGIFTKLEATGVDQCRRVDIAPGTEDVVFDPDQGLAFIAAADRRAWYNESGAKDVNPKNGVYALALDGSNAVTRVSPPMDAFLPHGIDLWIGPDGEKRLFVINHPPSGEEIVEIFAVGEGGALTHLESVSFPEMHSPNDVLAVGPRAFYATNDRGYETGLLAVLESYLALPFSSVVYYDGERGRIIQNGMTYANGIARAKDSDTIYIAEILKRHVAVFDWDRATGALERRENLPVNTGPDNLDIAPDGAIWIAGHSRIFDFLGHARDKSKIAPSHVIRLDPKTGETRDVFVATNGEINGSSVGAASSDTLIIGAVFDGHVVVCPL